MGFDATKYEITDEDIDRIVHDVFRLHKIDIGNDDVMAAMFTINHHCILHFAEVMNDVMEDTRQEMRETIVSTISQIEEQADAKLEKLIKTSAGIIEQSFDKTAGIIDEKVREFQSANLQHEQTLASAAKTLLKGLTSQRTISVMTIVLLAANLVVGLLYLFTR